MLDVIVMGSATLDVFLELESGSQQDKQRICFERGGKFLVENLQIAIGGGGTNVAVGLARLGYKVAYLGKIGSQSNAQRVLQELKQNKVRTQLINTGQGRTGYSVILNADHGDRSILAFKGSNNDLRWEDIPQRGLKARWLYASSLVGQSWETLKKVVVHCHKLGMGICFNPSSYLVQKGAKFLQPVLRYTNVLILNRDEAKLLVNSIKVRGKAAAITSLKDLFKALHALGPIVVCITEGKQGVHVSNGSNYHTIPANKRIKPVDTTGAGDAFGVGFLAGILARYEPVRVAQMGAINAESVIRHYGTKAGLLTWKEMKQALKKLKQSGSKISVKPL